jgi:hypothetical protein
MNDRPKDFIDFCQRRFGVDKKLWESYSIIVSNRSVYIEALGLSEAPAWQTTGRGLRAARRTSRSFKPGNRFLQWLDDKITKNRIELSSSEFELILEREKTVIGDKPHSRGYVALFYKEIAVGCGFWSGEDLRTQISKGISQEFPRQELET